jgi:hypothetical protein
MISPTELVAFVNAMYAVSDSAEMTVTGKTPSRAYATKVYNALFLALAPAGTQTQQINISANGDFVLLRILYAANIAHAAQTVNTLVVPEISVQITDGGSDENFAITAVNINSMASLAGNSNKDVDLPYPRVISGRSTLTLVATNNEAANTYNLEIDLVGVLVKTWGGPL